VERYLGSLPALNRHETWKDVGAHTPRGVITKQVAKGIEPKAQAAIIYFGPMTLTLEERTALRAMTEILQTRLLETIREDLGGTYSITARSAQQALPLPEFSISIGFSCDPKRLDDLVARIYQEIETFRTGGPTERQVADEREALQRDFETSSKQNGFWLGQLVNKYEYGEDPASILALADAPKRLDAPVIRAAATRYLKGDNRVQLTLVPEAK
jgi:zinc protease